MESASGKPVTTTTTAKLSISLAQKLCIVILSSWLASLVCYAETNPSPHPKLNMSFRKISTWTVTRYPEYGISISHPAGAPPLRISEQPDFETYFARSKEEELEGRDNDVAVIGGFRIPQNTFTDSYFQGGTVVILMKSTFHSRDSCKKFVSGEKPVYYNFNGISYASIDSSGAAMGHGDAVYYFHTFRNNLCYEIAFKFETYVPNYTNEPVRGSARLDEEDFFDIIRPIMSRLHFFRPELQTPRN